MKQISNNKSFKLSSLVLLTSLLLYLNSCGLYKPVDARKVSPNPTERIAKNQAEGKGIRFGSGKKKGGTFDFASSNSLWRASIDILDFVPFVNASYSGGILITEWFDGNSKTKNVRRELKITVRFLSNEIRADALTISIHERRCKDSLINCDIKQINSKLETEIKLAILKRAAYLKNDSLKK